MSTIQGQSREDQKTILAPRDGDASELLGRHDAPMTQDASGDSGDSKFAPFHVRNLDPALPPLIFTEQGLSD